MAGRLEEGAELDAMSGNATSPVRAVRLAPQLEGVVDIRLAGGVMAPWGDAVARTEYPVVARECNAPIPGLRCEERRYQVRSHVVLEEEANGDKEHDGPEDRPRRAAQDHASTRHGFTECWRPPRPHSTLGGLPPVGERLASELIPGKDRMG